MGKEHYIHMNALASWCGPSNAEWKNSEQRKSIRQELTYTRNSRNTQEIGSKYRKDGERERRNVNENVRKSVSKKLAENNLLVFI